MSKNWPKLSLSLHLAKKTIASPAEHRKVYRYSVVPGGVYSVEEFNLARRVDPVVAAHYAGFGPKLSATKLTRDMYVYVSYRKANRVYWSTKKHRVCEGETVITDGKNMARGRCGNRLSFTPYSPALDLQEPHERDLNTETPLIAGLPEGPLFAPSYPNVMTPDQYPSATAPAVYPSATPARSGASNPFAAPANFAGPLSPILAGPVFGAVGPTGGGTNGGGDNGGTSGQPPAGGTIGPDAPEPGSLFLLLTAAGVLAAWMERKKRLAVSD